MKTSLSDKITVISFVLIIFILSITNLISPNISFSENENRYLAKKPNLEWETIVSGEYSKNFEEYIIDHFIHRDKWVGLKSLSEIAMLKKENNSVFFAKDGYLIEKHLDKDIDKEHLERNIQRLIEFTNKNSNMNLSIMLIPTASNILKDKLPSFAQIYDQDKLIDTVKNRLESGIFVDVRDIFKQNKDNYIYYKTDHHYTTKGAFLAYQEWCKAMGANGLKEKDFNINPVSKNFFGTLYSKSNLYTTKPDTIYTYIPKEKISYEVDYNMGEKITDTLYETSYLDKKDKYSMFLNGNNPLVKIKSSNKNGKNLLVIKDSFAHSFVPFVANDFENVHMIDLRYFNMSMEKYIEENNITDVLVLYNTINFATDPNMSGLIK
ncbi:hypothetical protein KQI42_02370 [Tissierella sp. MSJ-40]|uniref:DHHW protein n=1 Tax=Tissierella simiarum TaxID=2841534 RepID=A0ABS6E207_9FIRM|nr:DHHW family protein [Tissierella simiarum]MBU5436834.1 hypothetical protein [Tissierella simiarum]